MKSLRDVAEVNNKNQKQENIIIPENAITPAEIRKKYSEIILTS